MLGEILGSLPCLVGHHTWIKRLKHNDFLVKCWHECRWCAKIDGRPYTIPHFNEPGTPSRRESWTEVFSDGEGGLVEKRSGSVEERRWRNVTVSGLGV